MTEPQAALRVTLWRLRVATDPIWQALARNYSKWAQKREEETWWAHVDLNHGPPRCERGALPLSHAPKSAFSIAGHRQLVKIANCVCHCSVKISIPSSYGTNRVEQQATGARPSTPARVNPTRLARQWRSDRHPQRKAHTPPYVAPLRKKSLGRNKTHAGRHGSFLFFRSAIPSGRDHTPRSGCWRGVPTSRGLSHFHPPPPHTAR